MPSGKNSGGGKGERSTEKRSEGVFVIYSRKSRFTGKGESVENQVEMCRSYLAGQYGEKRAAAALVYEDEGFSGGTLDRPRFKQMMQDSHGQKFAAIVVYRLDRISRNIGDFAVLIRELGEREIGFISIREQFDTSSPMGRAMMYIASVFSQLERETIAERIRDNMHELAKTGRWLGGVTPLGYESESLFAPSADGKIRRVCRLKPIPGEIALVRRMFELFLETGSLTKVDEHLLERQIRTRRGKEFSRFAIRGILTNPVYMTADEDAYRYMSSHGAELFSHRDAFDSTHGVMAYNRTLQRPGKANQINPMEEWIVSVGEHPGVVSGAVWSAVQEKLERNKGGSGRRPRGEGALLSGLLTCGVCGGHMRAKLTGRTTAEGEAAYTYICTRKERSRGKVCGVKNAGGNRLDAAVLGAVRELEESTGELARRLAGGRRGLDSRQEEGEAELSALRGEIRDLDDRTGKLLDALSRAGGTPAERCIMERINELERSGEGSRRRLKELEAAARPARLEEEKQGAVCRMLSRFGSCLDECTAEQKRELLRALVKRVVWDGKNVHVYLLGGEESGADRGRVPLGEDSK